MSRAVKRTTSSVAVAAAPSKQKIRKHEEDEDKEETQKKLTILQQVRLARKQRKSRKQLAHTLTAANEMLASVSANSVSVGTGFPDYIDPTCFCPFCKKPQTADDVLSGALDDPYDITTACSSCKKRYQTTLTVRAKAEETRIPWLCPEQTRDQYVFWASTANDADDLDWLFQKRPDIFWNAFRYAKDLGFVKKDNNQDDIDDAILKFLRDEE